MVTDFGVDVSQDADISVVRVRGEIDVHTCPKLHEALSGMIDRGDVKIVLNLEDVQYMDSTGLGTIAFNAKQLEKHEGRFSVVCTKPQIRKIFDISGLSRKNITLYDVEADALGSFNGSDS